jgi:hypothetical protein
VSERPHERRNAVLLPKPDHEGGLSGRRRGPLQPRIVEVDAPRAEAPEVADGKPKAPGPPMRVDADTANTEPGSLMEGATRVSFWSAITRL